MNVQIPFCGEASGNARWDRAYENEKNTHSGVYPLVVRNMWHTGIHLSNKEKKNFKDNFLKPMVEGELVAYKLASDYDILPLSTDEIRACENDEIRKSLENTKEHYPELYREIASITGRTDASIDNILQCIKSTEDRINQKKDEISKALTPFSTGFMLTRNKFNISGKGEVTYFMLYSNLAPISDYTPEREACRAFFRKWALKDADQLFTTNVAKLNLFNDAGCADKSGKRIGENGRLTLYKGVYNGTDLYANETFKCIKDRTVYYVKNTQIANDKLITKVVYADKFKLQSSKTIPLYYDKERKYLKCTINANDKITIGLGDETEDSEFNKLVKGDKEMKEQENPVVITFSSEKKEYEKERTHSDYFKISGDGGVFVKKEELEGGKKQLNEKNKEEFYYDKDAPLQMYEKETDENGKEQFIEKTYGNGKAYLHRYDGYKYTKIITETKEYIGIRRTRSSSNCPREQQEDGYLGEADAKARGILEAVYYAAISLPAAFSGNAQSKPELAVEDGFPVYVDGNGVSVRQIVFASELDGGNCKPELLDKEKRQNNVYEMKFEKRNGEAFTGYARIKQGAEIEHATDQSCKIDTVQTCNINKAELGYIGMQGFIYDNGVHIELFTRSLDNFKTDSKEIDDNDLENEIYFIANKNHADKIPVRACKNDDLFFEQPQAGSGTTPVIIVQDPRNYWVQSVHTSGGYSKCQFGELIKTDISLTSERGGYKFISNLITYHLVEVDNSKLYGIPKENIGSDIVYVSLTTGSPEYVNIDNKGWMRKNEAYRIERNIVISAQGTPPKPFIRSIYILKRKLTDTASWYAFDKDLLDCKQETLLTLIGTSPKYKLLAFKGHPTQKYKTGMKSWAINPIDNPFASDIRVKFTDTVRTGTRKDDVVRIKHGTNYYFFKNEAVTRMHLRNNVEEQKGTALLQYHILGLPFFNLLEDTNTDLKCDVVALNRKVEQISNSSGVKDRAGYQKPETFAKGIYSEEALYRTLNTLIIRCPSFWEEKESINLPDYGLQTNLVKYKDYIKKRLWMSGAVKRHMGVGGAATFYYFHPINFMRYVCGDLVQEINPYLGDHKDKDGNPFTCRSNPGFAPLYKEEDYRDNESNEKFEYEGKRYAVITGLFNKDYSEYYPKKEFFYHEGVDFRGKDGRKIISFVFGEVIMVGKLSIGDGYGNSIIVKPKNEDDIIYLLAHLKQPLVKEGQNIEPNQEVAEVGNSGTEATHLHISVIRTGEKEKEKIVKGTPDLYSFNIYLDYVDPFDREIEWRRTK